MKCKFTKRFPKFWRKQIEFSYFFLSITIFCVGENLKAQSPLNPNIISEISVRGNKAISEAKMIEIIKLPLINDSLEIIKQLKHLTSAFNQLGYYDFHIDSTYIHNGKLHIFVSEGEHFKLSKIIFTGNILLSSSDIETLMDTDVGEAIDEDVLEKDMDEILRKYESLSRPFTKVIPLETRLIYEEINGKRVPELELDIQIDEGKFVKVIGSKILGNTSTKKEIINREIRLREDGEPYNEEKFNLIQERLIRTNYFEKVNPPELLVINNNNPDTIEAIIQIELVEGNANTFDGVVGYQPPQNPNNPNDAGFFTGLINISLQNMFGTGRRLDVNWIKPNEFTQDSRLRYQEPYFLGLPLSIIFNFAQLKQDSTFTQLQLGLASSFRLADNVYITSSLAREEINPVFESITIAQLILPTTITLTGFGMIYDSRDYPISPQSGFYFKNDYKIGTKKITASDSLLSLYQIKTNVLQQRILFEAEFYKRTFKRQVFALKFHGEATLSDEIQFSDLIRFGGAQNLRGYREQQFLGSQIAWINSEYRFLLSRKSFLFGFYDLGYFFKPPNPLNINDVSLRDWKMGFGIGARVDTPLGLMGISYALGEGDSFSTAKVHFGIINSF